MKAKVKLPEFFELFHEDVEFKARFAFDQGEDQWFDASAGVGSPGYPASVCMTEVNFGSGWESPENFPQLNIEQCEQEIMDKIDELYEAFWAEYAEHMEREL